MAAAPWLSSQPLESTLSHDENPLLQEEIAHVPVAQVAVALAREQPTPQPLQLVVVRMLVSQPLTTLLSQLWNPVLQTGVQVPATHEVLPLVLVQAVVHAPQWLVSVCKLRHTLEQQAPFWQSLLTAQLPPSSFLQTVPAQP